MSVRSTTAGVGGRVSTVRSMQVSCLARDSLEEDIILDSSDTALLEPCPVRWRLLYDFLPEDVGVNLREWR